MQVGEHSARRGFLLVFMRVFLKSLGDPLVVHGELQVQVAKQPPSVHPNWLLPAASGEVSRIVIGECPVTTRAVADGPITERSNTAPTAATDKPNFLRN